MSNSLKPKTKAYLSIALALAITLKLGIILWNSTILWTFSFFNLLSKNSSSLSSPYFNLAWPIVLGQTHFEVSIVQVLQAIPPIRVKNSFPVKER